MSMVRWRKSSRSHPNDNCVEVALTQRTALVRDSKATDQSPHVYTVPAWHAFTQHLSQDGLD